MAHLPSYFALRAALAQHGDAHDMHTLSRAIDGDADAIARCAYMQELLEICGAPCMRVSLANSGMAAWWASAARAVTDGSAPDAWVCLLETGTLLCSLLTLHQLGEWVESLPGYDHAPDGMHPLQVAYEHQEGPRTLSARVDRGRAS